MASPLARELDRVEETAGEWRRSGARHDYPVLSTGEPSRLKSKSNVHHQLAPFDANSKPLNDLHHTFPCPTLDPQHAIVDRPGGPAPRRRHPPAAWPPRRWAASPTRRITTRPTGSRSRSLVRGSRSDWPWAPEPPC